MNRVEDVKSSRKKIEQLASRRANRQVATAKWNLNILVLAYAVLAITILLRLEGVAIEIVSSITVVGLAMIWFMAWRRGKKLYKDLYDEELYQLEELFKEDRVEVSTSSLLSQREMEILGYVARGYANKQIAAKLEISSNTVKNHVSFILRKLNVNDRTQAVLLAINQGWLPSQFGVPSRSN